MKTLIIYYSLEGNTKTLAEALASDLGADIERIVPKKEIKSKGFGKFIWGGRQVFMGKEPEIEALESNFEEYDLIIVGTPVWAGTFAPAIKTVLNAGLIIDKQVAFFCTHEGGPGKAILKFKEAVSGQNVLVDGIDLLNDKKDILQHREALVEWAKRCMTEVD